MSLLHVSSEGGPLILGDFEALRPWRGTDHSFETVCGLVDQSNPSPFTLDGAHGLVWDFEGPGTGDIVAVSETHISIVRIWPDAAWTDTEAESAIIASATARFGTEPKAHLAITSGYLLVLWAPEDASGFAPPTGGQGVPGPGLCMGDGGAYLRIPCGNYEATACEWNEATHGITKLDLRLVIGH